MAGWIWAFVWLERFCGINSAFQFAGDRVVCDWFRSFSPPILPGFSPIGKAESVIEVAELATFFHVDYMNLAEIEQKALALTDRDRASLVVRLLDTLSPVGVDVSDAEVDQRDQEIESGEVTAIPQPEFILGVQRLRGR